MKINRRKFPYLSQEEFAEFIADLTSLERQALIDALLDEDIPVREAKDLLSLRNKRRVERLLGEGVDKLKEATKILNDEEQ